MSELVEQLGYRYSFGRFLGFDERFIWIYNHHGRGLSLRAKVLHEWVYE